MQRRKTVKDRLGSIGAPACQAKEKDPRKHGERGRRAVYLSVSTDCGATASNVDSPIGEFKGQQMKAIAGATLFLVLTGFSVGTNASSVRSFNAVGTSRIAACVSARDRAQGSQRLLSMSSCECGVESKAGTSELWRCTVDATFDDKPTPPSKSNSAPGNVF